MATNYKKIGIAFIGILFLIIVGFTISIPIINDGIAHKTAQHIERIPLPPNTELVETFSAAGKLVGNGNGMQYLGGLLVKCELSLEDLQSYYSQYAESEWECIVERQTSKSIQFIEHGSVFLNADIEGDDYYIVYSWGDNTSLFSELDIRGH